MLGAAEECTLTLRTLAMSLLRWFGVVTVDVLPCEIVARLHDYVVVIVHCCITMFLYWYIAKWLHCYIVVIVFAY